MRAKVYSIKFTRTSAKDYKSLPSKVQREVALILEDISRDPLSGKPLQGPLKGLRSSRAGKYRIVYEQKKEKLIVLILSVAHRKRVYRRKKK